MGNWHHVYAPTKGLRLDIPSTMLEVEASPYIKGCYLKNGEIVSDFGHTAFPVVTDTRTNALAGSVMLVEQFFKTDGTSYLICLTTTNAYKYNTTTKTWNNITQGTVISDCETSWTGVLDSYVKVLLHCDTVTPAVVDEVGATVTNVDVTLDTTNKVFGTGSLLFNGTTARITIPDSSSTNFAANDFNISARIRRGDTARLQYIYGDGDGNEANSSVWVGFTVGDKVIVYVFGAANASITSTGTITDTNFHSIEVERYGNTLTLYIDGTADGTADVTGITLRNAATVWAWGRIGTFNSAYFAGNIDEVRISNGVARRMGNFTPETVAFGTTAATQATYKLIGTYAIKAEILAAFTTGIVAYENFSSKDLSTYTHLHCWIRSTITLASGDLKLRISEQNAGGTGASYEDVVIPVLTADTWTPICVAFAEASTTRNAVLSISLVVGVDKGALSVYLDDIRAVKAFTGDEDNLFSYTTMNNTFIVTNGVNQPQKYTGSGTFADLVTTLAAGSITTSELVLTFKDHLILFNNTENGADAPQRASWTNIGSIEDFINGTAGYQDLVDDESWVVAAVQAAENATNVYKERSIVRLEWVGGQTPFRFTTMVIGTGALSKNSVVDVDGTQYVLGIDSIYKYTGTRIVTPIDQAVNTTLYSIIGREYITRAFISYATVDNELQIWIPTTTAYPDDIWCLDLAKTVWYRKTRTMNCTGEYLEQSSFTIGDLVGTIGEQNWTFGSALTKKYYPFSLVGDYNGKVYKLDKLTLDNAGTAITNEFQTPDFVLPNTTDYLNKFMRVPQLVFEAKGQSVTTYYSTDGGSSWSPTTGGSGETTTLTGSFDIYQQDFDITCRKIRFKFLNITVTSGFYLRYYGFYWMTRSSRR